MPGFRGAIASAVAVGLTIGCAAVPGATLYGAEIHVERAAPAQPFSRAEQDTARGIIEQICRAERFASRGALRTDPLPSWPYVEFASLDGKGSEQDTVGVSGQMRTDRREILVSTADWHNGDPLPATEALVENLRAALASAFPDARVEVTRRQTSRLFGP